MSARGNTVVVAVQPDSLRVYTEAMTMLAEKGSTLPAMRQITEGLGDLDVRGKVSAIIDEAHRRFHYVADPIQNEYLRLELEPGATLDVDDFCVFVAAAAASLGIKTRFVLARYKRAWTCFVSYETDQGWEDVDVLRQPHVDVRAAEERLEGPIIGGAT